MDVYKPVNDVLVNLINEVWVLEGKAIITGEFRDLTNNDMHVIEAVGKGEGDNMSSIAKRLNVTVGTLTSSINRLVKKNYVERFRSEEDRRIVQVRLLDKGVLAFDHHAEYHRRMTEAVLAKLTEDEIPVLVKTLAGFSEFFREYHGIPENRLGVHMTELDKVNE